MPGTFEFRQDVLESSVERDGIITWTPISKKMIGANRKSGFYFWRIARLGIGGLRSLSTSMGELTIQLKTIGIALWKKNCRRCMKSTTVARKVQKGKAKHLEQKCFIYLKDDSAWKGAFGKIIVRSGWGSKWFEGYWNGLKGWRIRLKGEWSPSFGCFQARNGEVWR